MTAIDLAVIGWVALSALLGARRGLVSDVLSLGGFAAGAVIGSRLAPHLLAGGSRSSWLPFASLFGAVVGGVAAQAAAGLVAAPIRTALMRGPLRVLDALGGVAIGALLGVSIAWLLAVVAIQQPALGLRHDVRRSQILPALLRAVPADTLLHALARFDPLPVLPSIAGRALPPPDPSVLRSRAARRDRGSVVKVEGTACGLGIQGSGWVVRRDLVVTNAHVVAGEHETRVTAPGGASVEATVVFVNPGDDIAIVRAPDLDVRPLRMASRSPDGDAVVLLGYPNDGPLTAVAGRAGTPVGVISPDAYGRHMEPRTVVPLKGELEHGDSGGPVVTRSGRVVATMFARSEGGAGGFAVPLDPVRTALGERLVPVSSGPCIS